MTSALLSALLNLSPEVAVRVEVIPHFLQSYDTSGDWRWQDKALVVYVSDLNDERYHTLIAAHEIVEALLCAAHGISEESVTDFDVDHPELDEPGDDPRAPYHTEHMIASLVERSLAASLGVDWEAYSQAFDALPEWGEESSEEPRDLKHMVGRVIGRDK